MKSFLSEEEMSQYQGIELLSSGGQKAVYKFDHPTHGETVLKIGLTVSEAVKSRIDREVRILTGINSPYFPTQYDYQYLSDNRFLIIEEKISGLELAECVQNFSEPKKAISLLKHLVVGLNEIWIDNFVHRDLKPQNIIIKDDGVPVIIDLGIARDLDDDSLTHSGAIRGPCTPAYASPEQLLNKKRQISHRTDQFSLAIIVFQLICDGEHPFDPPIVGAGESYQENIINGDWARHIIERFGVSELTEMMNRMLNKEAYLRYPTSTRLTEAIDAILENLS